MKIRNQSVANSSQNGVCLDDNSKSLQGVPHSQDLISNSPNATFLSWVVIRSHDEPFCQFHMLPPTVYSPTLIVKVLESFVNENTPCCKCVNEPLLKSYINILF